MPESTVPVCTLPDCGRDMEPVPPYLMAGSMIRGKFKCSCSSRKPAHGSPNCEHRKLYNRLHAQKAKQK